MSIPTIAFFNNKGGVGRTSLVFHVAWMLGELNRNVLAVDLDPQANLTSAFLPETQLESLWSEHDGPARTAYQALRPFAGVGDISYAEPIAVTDRIGLLAGDLGLANFEDTLAELWSNCLGDRELYRPFRGMTALWSIAQAAAAQRGAEVILLDVGPNLGAINRAALIAAEHVLVPLAGDLFSIQGLRNLGPTLQQWRRGWAKRSENYRSGGSPPLALPSGAMSPLGYVVQQHQVRLDRPVRAYTRWMDRIPQEYRECGLSDAPAATRVEDDTECLAMVKHYRSLVPMAHEAQRPVFLLRSADGAVGAHGNAVRGAYTDFRALTQRILERIDVS